MSFRPLSGIRVLDLTRLLPGPYGTSLLCDLGADVVKIEEPERGDYLREIGDGEPSEYFQVLNAGKRSVALDLKADSDREAFLELATAADVVVESFRPGVVEELGVGYETVCERNPDVVYASLSGYGRDGPYRDRPGHDINYTGVSGILHLNGTGDGPPIVPGTTIADLASGTMLALSVLAALCGGNGTYIDCSITDVAATWTLPYVHGVLAGSEPPECGRTRHQSDPGYDVYRCGDDRYIAISAIEPVFWKRLCEAIGEPNLAGERCDDPAAHRALEERLRNAFGARPRDDWIETLLEADVPVGPVNDLCEMLSDPHIEARKVFIEAADSERPGFPSLFDGERVAARGPVPDLGEDTEALLETVGRSESDLERTTDEEK